MNRKHRFITILVAAVAVSAAAVLLIHLTGEKSAMADYYVSPEGNDGNPGTLTHPFATLERARDAVRELKKDKKGDRIIELLDGRYELLHTLVLGPEDGAREGQKIIYRAARGANPVLSGGRLVTQWKPVEWSGDIWKAALPAGAGFPRTLYCGDTRLPRARGKGFIPLYEYPHQAGPHTDTIEFPPGALRSYPDMEHAEIVARTSAGWGMNILPLLYVNEEEGIARTAPFNYSLGRIRHRSQPGDNIWVENVLEELDTPGEWVVHPDAGKIYYMPLEGKEPGNIYVPMLNELIRVEGHIDYKGPEDIPVRGIFFEGLTFMHTDRVPPPEDIRADGIQHGWDYFDYPNAILRFRGAEDCGVYHCRFTAGGDNAIRLDLHARNIRVENSLFEYLGGAAAVFAGYGLGTKDVNRDNAFVNNHVHHVSELKWDRPAVFLWQSGHNLISRNLIHHVPYTGIVISTRAHIFGAGDGSNTRRAWEIPELPGLKGGFYDFEYEPWNTREPFMHGRHNLVEYNELFAVMQVMDDGNAIYISGTGRDNVVRKNFIHNNWTHNIGAAIRCDDDQHETLIEKNIIVNNAGRACGIVSKGRNYIRNNLMVNLYQTALHHFGMIFFQSYLPDGSVVERNVLYCSDPGNVVPVVAGRTMSHLGGVRIELGNCHFRDNIFWSPGSPGWADQYLSEAREKGLEEGSVLADPLFRDIEKYDFRFQPGSPARSMGIEEVTTGGMGLDLSHWNPFLAGLSEEAREESLKRAIKQGQVNVLNQ